MTELMMDKVRLTVVSGPDELAAVLDDNAVDNDEAVFNQRVGTIAMRTSEHPASQPERTP